MTVKELINELECYDDNMEVEFAYNYGDYWNTTVCKTIKDVGIGFIEYSDYHRMDKLINIDDIDEETDARKEVLILQ